MTKKSESEQPSDFFISQSKLSIFIVYTDN